MKHALLIGLILAAFGASAVIAEPLGPVHYPQDIQRSCKGGRAQIYDECNSQFEVLAQALAEAEHAGKHVLVVYGAEWCIWCHVFHKYLAGETGVFRYVLEGDALLMAESRAETELAARLRDYASETFVLAHIESEYSPDGWEVLEHLGATPYYERAIPFIFVLRNGTFAAALPDPQDIPGFEVRREGFLLYRGYDREMLLSQLQKLADAAE